jgi:hypothetical protein
MKRFHTYESFDTSHWKIVGKGSESDVYSDGKYAYKVMHRPDAQKYVGKKFKNVVNVLDVEEKDGEYVVKMELLQKISPEIANSEACKEANRKLWDLRDEVIFVQDVLEETTDPEVRKMLSAIINAGKELHTDILDLGFHNLMYDPKTKEYKQVDIF